VRMFVNEADPQSNSHRQKLEIFQRAFPRAFRGFAGDIEPAALRKWIKARSANGNTQAMYYRYCRMFFAYLKSNRLIADDPMGGVPAPKTKPGRNILTPAQMKALLDLELPDHVRALLLLGGFAGLRTEEVSRMTWDNVNTESGQIHVPPGAMKDSGGFDQRIVDFTEPLNRRKDWMAEQKGKIIPVASETLHTHRRRACSPVLAEVARQLPAALVRHLSPWQGQERGPDGLPDGPHFVSNGAKGLCCAGGTCRLAGLVESLGHA
jgi:integrase